MNEQIIDSHQHFWQIGRFDYGWMSPADETLYRDFLPADFGRILAENGVARSVAVQAHQSVEETYWLLDLAAEYEFIAGVVGWVDLRAENVAAQLAELCKYPQFKGVRHLVQDEMEDDWLLKPEVVRGIKTLAEYDLSYDLLIFPRHLKNAAKLLESCPEVRFVIDHAAKPPIAAEEMKEWAAGMKTVAAFPNVCCKLSGLVTEAAHQSWTIEGLRPFVETTLALFGAERLLFGSDYPVCRLAASYQKVLATMQELLIELSESERRLVFRENAIKFYKL